MIVQRFKIYHEPGGVVREGSHFARVVDAELCFGGAAAGRGGGRRRRGRAGEYLNVGGGWEGRAATVLVIIDGQVSDRDGAELSEQALWVGMGIRGWGGRGGGGMMRIGEGDGLAFLK